MVYAEIRAVIHSVDLSQLSLKHGLLSQTKRQPLGLSSDPHPRSAVPQTHCHLPAITANIPIPPRNPLLECQHECLWIKYSNKINRSNEAQKIDHSLFVKNTRS